MAKNLHCTFLLPMAAASAVSGMAPRDPASGTFVERITLPLPTAGRCGRRVNRQGSGACGGAGVCEAGSSKPGGARRPLGDGGVPCKTGAATAVTEGQCRGGGGSCLTVAANTKPRSNAGWCAGGGGSTWPAGGGVLIASWTGGGGVAQCPRTDAPSGVLPVGLFGGAKGGGGGGHLTCRAGATLGSGRPGGGPAARSPTSASFGVRREAPLAAFRDLISPSGHAWQ
jgi:hypothetical protein